MKKDTYFGLSPEGFHRIAYQEWGEANPTRPPVICAHGLTRNSHDFDDLAKYMAARGHHLFCPDIVGRGNSDWLTDPKNYTYEQYAADLTGMIARTHANHVDWVGTSMGGLIGMFMASLKNSPIRLLVLNDIGPYIAMSGLAHLTRYSHHEPRFDSIEAANQYFRMIYEEFGELSDQQWDDITEKSIRKDGDSYTLVADPNIKVPAVKSKMVLKALLSPIKAMKGKALDIDVWHIWKTVTCPVLVIRGANSKLLLPETVQEMQQSHPKVDVVEIPDVGHAPALLSENEHKIIYEWLEDHRNE